MYFQDIWTVKPCGKPPITGIVCVQYLTVEQVASFSLLTYVGSTNFESLSSGPIRHHGYFSHCMLLEIKQAVIGRAVYVCRRVFKDHLSNNCNWTSWILNHNYNFSYINKGQVRERMEASNSEVSIVVFEILIFARNILKVIEIVQTELRAPQNYFLSSVFSKLCFLLKWNGLNLMRAVNLAYNRVLSEKMAVCSAMPVVIFNTIKSLLPTHHTHYSKTAHMLACLKH